MPDDRYTVKASVNGFVNIRVTEGHYQTGDVYELAQSLLDAAYQAKALQLIDEVLSEHRRRYVDEIMPEWRAIDAAWRDLRLAIGYDDDPRGGAK
jgi:hypothetical protein